VAEVVHKIGKDGVVTIEESPVFGIQKEFIDGMETYGGIIEKSMVTDTIRQRAVLQEFVGEDKQTIPVAVLVTDKFLHQAIELIPIIRGLRAKGVKQLAVFALGFDYDVLELILLNNKQGNIHIIGVQISEINHEIVLADIAASCGATVVTKIRGERLEEAPLTVLGEAKKIISDAEKTTIISESGKLPEYIAMLQNQLKEDTQEKRHKSLQRRIAKLSGGIAVIRLGAPSDSELAYMRHKLEDTINATQAAAEEGVVPGGGVALVRAAKELSYRKTSQEDQDWRAGYYLLQKAISKPLLQIVRNKGKQNAESVLEKIQESEAAFFGYDAKHDKYVNMFTEGIIDPVKVTRNSLEKAVSVATLVLTTEVAVTNRPEKL
jgi:chaperonin GroEL